MGVGFAIEEAVRGSGGHQNTGSACYGDSGGQNFVVLDGKWVLAATTITGDVPCYANNVAYRLDSESARHFLKPFVTLP